MSPPRQRHFTARSQFLGRVWGLSCLLSGTQSCLGAMQEEGDFGRSPRSKFVFGVRRGIACVHGRSRIVWIVIVQMGHHGKTETSVCTCA